VGTPPASPGQPPAEAITPWLRRIEQAESEEHLDQVREEMNRHLIKRTRAQGEVLRRAIDNTRQALRAAAWMKATEPVAPGPEAPTVEYEEEARGDDLDSEIEPAPASQVPSVLQQAFAAMDRATTEDQVMEHLRRARQHPALSPEEQERIRSRGAARIAAINAKRVRTAEADFPWGEQ
jgi:hypothetical protein